MDAMKLLAKLMGNNATGGNLLGMLLKGAMSGGGAPTQQKSGGLGGLLGGMFGGRGTSLLGGLLAAGGGKMLGGLLGGGEQAQSQGFVSDATPADQDAATLLIRAMCNAAKADGTIDEQEQQNIIGRLGDEVDDAEANFVRQELAAPLDVKAFAASVPAALAEEVYTFSLATIVVDTPEEADYMRQLAAGLNLSSDVVSRIHQQYGQ